MLSKRQKKTLRRLYKECLAIRQKDDPLEFSLTGRKRTHYKEEGYIDYGIFDFDGDYTDDEIEEWFDNNLKRRIPSYIYWDCSGMYFTEWLTWHRNPNGMVSFVHSVGIDI